MFWRDAVICLASLLLAFNSALSQAQNSSLLEILKTRSRAVQTFQARVKLTELPGPARKELAKDTHLFAIWLSKNRPDLPWQESDKRATYMEKAQPPKVNYYRYLAQPPGRIRIEAFGGGDDVAAAFARKPELNIYSEEKWYQYTPPERIPKGGGWGHLNVPQQGLPSIPGFEVARTEGLKLGSFPKASNRSIGMDQMGWEEFLKSVSPNASRELTEPLPTGGPALPLLEMSTAPPEGNKATPPRPETKLGLYRVRIWFDQKQGYIPIRMEGDHLNYNFQTNSFYYVPDQIAEWSDPVQLSNGMRFSQKCTLHIFNHFMPPLQGESDGNRWPEKAYEFAIEQFEFSNVRINEPLDAGLFKFVPPPNTNVIDEVSGYHYAVGSTGELIKKEALSYQTELPPPVATVWPTWKKALLAGLLLAVGVVGLLVLLRLLRPAKARKVP